MEKLLENNNDEFDFITSMESVIVKDNKAIITSWNKTEETDSLGNYHAKGTLYETVHDYSTGEILLDSQIGYFSREENAKGEGITKYRSRIRQFYPKPTLFNEMKNWLIFMMDSL
jgi:hypothetical protein